MVHMRVSRDHTQCGFMGEKAARRSIEYPILTLLDWDSGVGSRAQRALYSKEGGSDDVTCLSNCMKRS